jgi:hypothetical protein
MKINRRRAYEPSFFLGEELIRCEEMMEGSGANISAAPHAGSYFRTPTAMKWPETDRRQLQSSAGGDCGVH